jgi:hypothetical protein
MCVNLSSYTAISLNYFLQEAIILEILEIAQTRITIDFVELVFTKQVYVYLT